MVEVGSYCGRSTVWVGAAARSSGVTLYAVDHHGGSEENQPGWEWFDDSVVDATTGKINTLPFFTDTMTRAGLTDVVRAVVGDSAALGHAWREKLSFLFIDGGHGREIARADFSAWHDHVALNGIFAIHDVFTDPADGGQAPYEEIYLPAISSGKFRDVSATGSLRVLLRVS
jgi:predicted O-methyltransferase YrrM